MGLHVRDNPAAGRVWIENDRGKRVSEIDVENVGPGPGSLGLAHEMASASELLSQLRAIVARLSMDDATVAAAWLPEAKAAIARAMGKPLNNH